MVFRSFTGVKSGGLRAYNICLLWLLPIPAKIMELTSWVSCHHKVHTCTHSLFYECLHTRAARNLTPVASHHLNTLSCISVNLFSHRAVGNITSAWEQADPTSSGARKAWQRAHLQAVVSISSHLHLPVATQRCSMEEVQGQNKRKY